MAGPRSRVVLPGRRIHLPESIPRKNFLSLTEKKFPLSLLGFIPIFVIIRIETSLRLQTEPCHGN